MKKIAISSILCIVAAMCANAQQNQVQRNVVTVTLTAAPTGDCRSQFYQIAVDPSGNEYFCNATTGVWTQGGGSGVTGSGVTVLQTSPTITTPVISSITNTGTETLPSVTGGIPIVIACGSTTTGTGTCANTAVGATSKVYFGAATLASNAQVVTISPGYTSSSTYFCVGNDVTTRANPVQVVPTSATTFTITNTTGASDVIQYICVGY